MAFSSVSWELVIVGFPVMTVIARRAMKIFALSFHSIWESLIVSPEG